MILRRLYELAEREKLADDPAFEAAPIPYIIKVGRDGEFLGIEERRGEVTIPTRKGPPKTKPDRGKELLATRAHGNTANSGFARFFADTLARVLPVCNEPKSMASRKTFWEQMAKAAADTGDPALLAACVMGRTVAAEAVAAELGKYKPGPGDRCTLAWHPDEGLTILDREPVRQWWRGFYTRFDQARQGDGPQGICQITGEMGPIALTHPKLPTIPGGMSAGVCVVSNDKDAFLSYGLDGAANAAIGFRAAEGYTRALTALIQQKLHRSRIGLGGTLFLFWTRQKCEMDDMLACFDSNNPELVAKVLRSFDEGREATAMDTNEFYCLTLSGNSARAVIRDYLEARLPEVKTNLRQWFTDLRIVEPWGKELVTYFPLWQLALATARESDGVLPSLPGQFINAALKNLPLADNVLAACLKRLAADGADGFRATRMGLIKLILTRKGTPMSEELNVGEGTPAYLCGRLMAVFERLQFGALGNVNANIVDRFYGTASTSPGLVYPRLFKSAQQHLGKLQGEKPGMAVNMQKDIERVCGSISAFPNLLTLTQQGEFALGFYHQRAAYRKGKDNQ